MDVNHVAFASIRKFDGKRSRLLSEPELAQIAGRAGRHMNDGTFGVTANAPVLSLEMVERIEQHRFMPIKKIYWRNPNLELSSIKALKASLRLPPQLQGLVRAGDADDEVALDLLASSKEILDRVNSPDSVALLWEVCQIPDFRKVMSDAHTSLLSSIFMHLMDANNMGRLPADWIAKHLQCLDRVDGSIENLTGRLANIRTWTYVAHRGDWLDDTKYWQERTRYVEDKLSDSLHQCLTQRFVDQRTSVLVKQLRSPDNLLAVVKGDGGVTIEGHLIGRLIGFCFVAVKASEPGIAEKYIKKAAKHALMPEIRKRISALETASNDQITLRADGFILFNNVQIAYLSKGGQILSPDVRPISSEVLGAKDYERILMRLKAWCQQHIESILSSLFLARRAKFEGAARGLVFQLAENLGSLPRKTVKQQIDALTKEDRKKLRSLGITIGSARVYFPALLKPGPSQVLGLLWVLWNNQHTFPEAPDPSRVSIPSDTYPSGYLFAIGFQTVGSVALRFDIFERVSTRVWKLGRKGSFVIDSKLLSLAGCSSADIEIILKEIGFCKLKESDMGFEYALSFKKAKCFSDKNHKENGSLKKVKVDPNSPFAVLEKLNQQP